jgi:hypothetical protein
MFEFFKNMFKSTPIASTETVKLFTKKGKSKTYIEDSDLPTWVEDTVMFNCGWSEDKRGFLAIVVRESTPPKSN